ncbi:hypothetical protein GCM10027284_38280 [Cyclobacterium sediminis]
MCKIRTIIFSTVTYFLFTITTSAQDSVAIAVQQPLSIGLHVGYSANSPAGGAKKGLNHMISTFEGTGSDNFKVKGNLPYQFSPVVGLFADYNYNRKIAFSTGINFTMRGYTLEIEGVDRDPEYQFDQFANYTEKYKLHTIEVPISIQYKPSSFLSLGAGLQIGSGLAHTSKTTTTIDQRVEINGETNEEYPEKKTTVENNLNEEVLSPYFGYFASAGYFLSKRIELKLSLLKSGNYAETTYGKLSDTSLVVSVRFGLLSL